jgi:glutathionyl-hydroquinone reductase
MTSVVEHLQGLKANLEEKQFFKGDLSTLAMGVIITMVVMFMGVYMISMVSELTAINNTSDFYSTWCCNRSIERFWFRWWWNWNLITS